MIAFSVIPEFEVRLPSPNDNTSILNLFVQIRDTLECVTEFNITSVIVTADASGVNALIDALQSSVSSLTSNPIVQLLSTGNQNTIGQIITSFSQQLNKINTGALESAVSSELFRSFISELSMG
jgi:hypothetical protein